jgi:K+-transporting ATPase c subunit
LERRLYLLASNIGTSSPALSTPVASNRKRFETALQDTQASAIELPLQSLEQSTAKIEPHIEHAAVQLLMRCFAMDQQA